MARKSYKPNWALGILMATATWARAENIFQKDLGAVEKDDVLSATIVANTKNPELGRAWVEYSREYKDENPEIGLHFDSVKVKIPGLSFRSSSNEVLLEKNGKSIVCGHFKRPNMFHPEGSFEQTGHCLTSIKTAKTLEDDDFETQTRLHAKLLFSTNP